MNSKMFILTVLVLCCLFHGKYVNANKNFEGKRNQLRSERENTQKSVSQLEEALTTLQSEMNTRIDEVEMDIESLKSDVHDILTHLDFNKTSHPSSGNDDMKDCTPLRVQHAVVTPATTVNHGTMVAVECPSPFTLVGNPTPKCINGVFTDIPSCENSDVFDISEMRVANKKRINITLSSDAPWYSAWISGSKFLSDGRLILVDGDNYKIKLLSSDFEIEETLSFREGFISVFSVGIINDTTVVITEPLENQIEFVQVVPRLQRERIVNIGIKCYGVDVLKDTIYLACYDGRIRRYDMDGHFKDKLTVRFQGPYWITVNHVSENLCVADWNARSVTCITPSGDVLFTYTDPSLKRPQAVLVDDLDSIIIADWRNNNIQVIKNSDKSYRNLLTSNDGIQSPYSLAYRRSDKTLVVGLQWTNWFHIVKLI